MAYETLLRSYRSKMYSVFMLKMNVNPTRNGFYFSVKQIKQQVSCNSGSS